MRRYTVAVVGAGLVGRKMVEILLERRFPATRIVLLATRSRKEKIAGQEFSVGVASESSFDGVDIALFAGTEGERGASRQFGWTAVQRGCVVIDNGSDFRMDPRVPLVVPEVNADALAAHQGFVANPNCSTIQMVMALCPLHRTFGVRRVIASTYQAVSGTGRAAVDELRAQVEAHTSQKEATPTVYPKQIAFNLLPHIGSPSAELPGYYTEEAKMVYETRKILGIPDLPVAATCVRVPVYNAHSESVTVELQRQADPQDARDVLASFPGVRVADEPADAVYPTPLEVSGTDEVWVGRVRRSQAFPAGLDLWIVADNIRKGAALNAVQIAEEMIARKLL